MTKFLQTLLATILAAGFSVPCFAQEKPASNYSYEQCESAKLELAKLQAQTNIPWAAQKESEKWYGIWSSPECREYRNREAFDVRDDMDEINRKLAESGISTNDADLTAIESRCELQVEKQWNSADQRFRKMNSKPDMLGTCIANGRMRLYADAVGRLQQKQYADLIQELPTYATHCPQFVEQNHDKSQADVTKPKLWKKCLDDAYEKSMQERLDKVAADKIDYEARVASAEAEHDKAVAEARAKHEAAMAEWRRKSDLCKKGEREFCAK